MNTILEKDSNEIARILQKVRAEGLSYLDSIDDLPATVGIGEISNWQSPLVLPGFC